jgi:hypothetical protein
MLFLENTDISIFKLTIKKIMKKNIYLITTFCFFIISSFAQQTTIKKFNGLYYESDMITTNDHGFAICGLGASNAQQVYKLDSNYQVQWGRTIGLSGYETADRILQLKDGGFLVFGRTQQVGSTLKFLLAVRLSASGNLLWSKQYVPSIFGIDIYMDKAIALTDSTFIMAGNIYSTPYSFIAAEINLNGDLLWNKVYILPGGGSNLGSITKANDTSFIVTGTTNLRNKPQPYTARIDNMGNIIWAKKLSSAFASTGSGIIRSGNNFFITGSIDSSILLTKIDGSGNVTASGKIGGTQNDYASTILNTNDGNILLAGKSNSFSTGIMNAYIVKLKKSGQIMWSATTYIGNRSEILSSMETTKNEYVLLANQFDFDSIGQNHIIQLTANGSICNNAGSGGTVSGVSLNAMDISVTVTATGIAQNGPNQVVNITLPIVSLCPSLNTTKTQINENIFKPVPDKPNFSISPNPVSGGMLTMSFSKVKSQPATIIITDIQGRSLVEKRITILSSQFAIDVSSLGRGLYYIRLKSENLDLTGKFIKIN